MSKVSKNTHNQSELYVVGVGASAGGLDAISKLITPFDASDHNFCVVVVMHLSPDYKSELTNILSKRCKWEVETVTQDIELRPKTIYVTPQNRNIVIEHNHLKLEQLAKEYTSAPSINSFFSSLAMSKHERAIGIVLSGFGSDGAEGIVNISRNSGHTIAQLPETAEHKDMPKSAINTDYVDAVLPAEHMFDQIVKYVNQNHLNNKTSLKKEGVNAIFDLLEKHSGTDFSLYKSSTIMRRINHRMNALKISSLGKYHEMLLNEPNELDNLFDTVLIGVTEFFRDPKSFKALKGELEKRIENKAPGDSIRIWSVGCATGEEPYSIAILLNEILGKNINKYHIQIFATDIDEKALFFARKGVYFESSLKNISEDLRNKYFDVLDNNHFELRKQVKKHVLFTRHNIGNDPPFVKLDLISCRNLLIYFSNELQKQTFQIFHYSLRPKGLLFLGKSESISVTPDLFNKQDAFKLFQKVDTSLNYQLKFSRFTSKEKSPKTEEEKTKRHLSLNDIAKETLFYKYDHPFVIITEQADIREVHGSLRLYMEISQGAMNANIYKMANKELVNPIKALLAQVKKTKVPHKSHVIEFKLYEQDHYVRIKIMPLIYKHGNQQYFMTIFEKIKPNNQLLEIQKKLDTTDFVNHRIKTLEEELASSQEHLQIFTEELETTNEELQTINEELQSANEELKSTNEELETANEELQSANEELNTANNELRLTNENLIEKEEELKLSKLETQKNEQLYRSIAERIPNGTVGVLNKDYTIENINGQILENLGLKQKDLKGKSFIDLNPLPEERDKLRALLESTFTEKNPTTEVRYLNRIFEVQTTPISLMNERESKIMFLSQDISDKRKEEIKLKTAIKAAKLVVYEYNYKTDEFKTTPPFRELFGYDKAIKITKKSFLAKINKEDHSIIEKRTKKAFKTGELNYEVRLKTNSKLKWIRVFGRIIFDANGKPDYGIATINDITQDKQYLELIEERERHFRLIADSVPVIIWVSDPELNLTFLNKTFYNYIGAKKGEYLGLDWLNAIHPDDRDFVHKTFSEAVEVQGEYRIEFRIRDKNDKYHWFLVYGNPIFNSKNIFEGYIGSCVDITTQRNFRDLLEHRVTERTIDLKLSNEKLKKANSHLEEFAYVASHDLQEPLRKIRVFNSMFRDISTQTEKMELVDKIEDSASRLAQLITNILEYGQIFESEDQSADVNLDQIIRDIQNDLELVIENNNAEIIVKNLDVIKGNYIQLYQVFSNLIKNGLKFNDKEQPIIRIKRNEISGSKLPKSYNVPDPEVQYAVFTVKDNGIGLKKTGDKRDIFKPFKQLHSKSSYPGTGIGLAICKKIVELHKGFIDVRNNRDDGVTFYVYLPIEND